LHKRTILFALVALLAAGSALADHGPLTVPVGGSFTDATGGTGTFTGQFTLVQFASDNNALVANGFLSGMLTDSHGKVLGSVFRNVSIPVTASQAASGKAAALASCGILHLDLGPLSLDLLGLQVNLSEVILDITAQSGAGNLLGNLLCAVTNLLNGPTGPLATLLNQILQAITGILG
jgi:hypothetical protein